MPMLVCKTDTDQFVTGGARAMLTEEYPDAVLLPSLGAARQQARRALRQHPTITDVRIIGAYGFRDEHVVHTETRR
jgi:hypothetical protein